jgi:RNA polymerase sigma-70 factor, ECF subfamily
VISSAGKNYKIVVFSMGRESNFTGIERQLVVRSLEGDWEAFEALVALHEKHIYYIAFCILANTRDAEDVLQETFFKAYEHLEQFHQGTSFYSWIVMVALDASLQRIHKDHPFVPLGKNSETDEELPQ